MIVIGDCGDDMEHLPPPNVAVDPAESMLAWDLARWLP